ncbi:MAG TPA: HVO_0476 family zinc finger protein [Thermoplasmata archaeon]|nr:HVO_0476 family zinc finger protein [Thermoplasmata archaeon]
MTTPTSVMVECPICKEETLHGVLAGRISGRSATVLDSTVKCRACGHVHHAVMKGEKPVSVPVVISWLTESTRSSITLGPDEALAVDDEIVCGELPVLVTSIESKGARVDICKAGDIDTIWGKRFDKVKVLFSVNHHGKTYSEHMIVSPDEEFFIGDMIDVGKRSVVIHTIKTNSRTLRKGAAIARDIVRVYANIVRKTSS